MLKYGNFHKNDIFLGENGTSAGRAQNIQLFACLFIGFRAPFQRKYGIYMGISENHDFVVKSCDSAVFSIKT